jgi:hypothetical protein
VSFECQNTDGKGHPPQGKMRCEEITGILGDLKELLMSRFVTEIAKVFKNPVLKNHT